MIEVELPDGRLLEVDTDDPEKAASAARNFLSGQQERREAGTGNLAQPQQPAPQPAPEPPQEARQEPSSFLGKIMGRMTGTDVDDPNPLGRMSTVTAGAIGGAMLGSRTPVAPGPAGVAINPVTGAIVGGVTGATGGAVAPEATMEALEFFGFMPKGTRERRGLSNEELRTVAEGEALVDLTFGIGAQSLGLAGRAGSRALAGIGKEETELAERAAQQGLELPAFAFGKEGGFSRFFTSVFGRFPLIGGPLHTAGRKAEAQAQRIANELPNRVGEVFSESTVGRRIYNNARTLVKQTGDLFNQRYDRVFREADEAGVLVRPEAALGKANEALDKILRETPPEGTAGKTLEKVRSFIVKEIQPLLRPGEAEQASAAGRQIAEEFGIPLTSAQPAELTLRQMDGLISKIDQEIASFEPGQRKFAAALLKQIKQAAQFDGLHNLSGEGAEQIGRELRELDADFSQTMKQLFETSTAKRFGTVRRRGLRGLTRDEAQRTPVDRLAKTVVDLDSPQAIEELSRLVTPDTMRDVAARALDDAFDRGFRTTSSGQVAFNPEPVRQALGLNRKASARADAIGTLLKKTGGLDRQALEAVLDGMARLAQTEIPNMSTFIARRGTIGGMGSIVRGILPGVALTSAGAAGGGVAGGVFGGLMGMLLSVGGGRAVSSMLANPTAARSLKAVMSKQASRSNKTANAVRLLRFGVDTMVENGDLAQDAADSVFQSGRQALIDLARTLNPRGEATP